MLRPRKKLSKREIKEDPLVTLYGKVQFFIGQNKRIINTVALVIAGIAVLLVLMIRSKRQAEQRAESRIAVAEQYYHFGYPDQARDEFLKVLKSFKGTQAAGRAAFYLANLYFESKDYSNAEAHYRLYVERYGQIDFFTASSLAGIAACVESRGEFNLAAQYYEKAARKYPKLFQAPAYLKEAARCYLAAGQFEKARSIYRFIQEKYPETAIAKEVEILSQRISS